MRQASACIAIAIIAGIMLVSAAPAPAQPKPPEKRIAVEMRNVPWPRVLEWLSDQTGLPVISNHVPVGSFTFFSPKDGKEPAKYSISEVIDLLNDALVGNHQLLVRSDNRIILVLRERPIDPSLVPQVNAAELKSRGRTELLSITIPLDSVGKPKDAQDVRELLGPLGEVVVLEKANRVVLRDTAANLRRVLTMLDAAPLNPAKNKPANQELDELAYVYLTSITSTDKFTEAILRNRLTAKEIKLRSQKEHSGFRIMNLDDTMVRLAGNVVRIDTRDIYIQANGQTYLLHVGENLRKALTQPLSEAEIKRLNLPAASK